MEGAPADPRESPTGSDRPTEGGWLPPKPPGPPPDLGDSEARTPEPAPAAPPPVPPGHQPPPSVPPTQQPPPPPAAPAEQPPPTPAQQPPPAQYGWQQQQPYAGWHQPPPPPPSGWAPQQTWLPPPGWYPQPVDTGPGNGQAVAGFILALSALGLLAFSFGLLFILALPCAVLAIVFGRKGRARVDAGETAKHRGIAQAGFVIGIVSVVLSLLSAAGWIALIASDDEFLEDLDNPNDDLDSVSGGLLLAVRIAFVLAA
jgi:hypothetical protein